MHAIDFKQCVMHDHKKLTRISVVKEKVERLIF